MRADQTLRPDGVIITYNYVGQLEDETDLKAPKRFGAQQTTAYQRLPVV